MGWGTGTNAAGREIGYLIEATCDHTGCKAKIDRGLSYVCGRQMHDDGELSCDKYFCPEHVTWPHVPDGVINLIEGDLCKSCCDLAEKHWAEGTFNTDIPEEEWPENFERPESWPKIEELLECR